MSVELTAYGTIVAGAWDATADVQDGLVGPTLLLLASIEATSTGAAAARFVLVANLPCASVAISATWIDVVGVGGRTFDLAKALSRVLVVGVFGTLPFE